jgi:hypothetical protein
VSHNKERKEKNCLNCNAFIYGRYCHICGQENIEPKESFFHLINHFVEDITHFDGKFFSTLKDLLFKPGFLSREYLRGKRASYLHPIRMYVFTSAIFFLIFFSFVHIGENGMEKVNRKQAKNGIQVGKGFDEKYSGSDSSEDKITDSIVKVLDSAKHKNHGNSFVVIGDTIHANTIKEYDSMQASLPPGERDNWLKRIYERRSVRIKQNLQSHDKELYKKLFNELVHSTPKMMFILLPLIALLLRLLYIRKKQLLYIDHAIFIIHLFIAIYILWLFSYGLSYLGEVSGIRILNYLAGFMFFVIQFYEYKAMRNFYGQSRIKTILKYGIFNFITLLFFIFIGVIFFLNTASEQIN